MNINQARKTGDKLSRLLQNSIELNTGPAMDELIDKIGNAKIVMLGEASHGTHEYYTWRALLSKRLIEEKGFSFVAVEGDWPDCYNLNRSIKNYAGACPDVVTALHAFNRWPTWMWANWEMVAFIKWLQDFNRQKTDTSKIGFYGLDVYSLWESLEAIIKYLDKKDPGAKKTALKVMRCFDPYRHDEGMSYARISRLVPPPCEKEVIELLVLMRKNAERYGNDSEETLNAKQNAWIIADAENYYRTMLVAGISSWNIRDRHMVDTLNRLLDFHGADAKAIVWEHNTHVGDARATDMWNDGMINVGQLVREQNYEDDVYTVGFGSYQGKVIAAAQWGGPAMEMDVPPAMPDSWENLLHELPIPDKHSRNRIVFMNQQMLAAFGTQQIPHRAIGITYNPAYEDFLNYVPSYMPNRYNAFVYIDETTALHPLHVQADQKHIPETYPFGL